MLRLSKTGLTTDISGAHRTACSHEKVRSLPFWALTYELRPGLFRSDNGLKAKRPADLMIQPSRQNLRDRSFERIG